MPSIKLSASASIAIVATVSSGALAAPFQYPKCKIPNVKAPNNGAGVLFDEECRTGYVLPPISGEARLEALAQNTNLQFCPAARKAGDVANSTMDSAGIIAENISEMIKDFKPLEQEILDLRMKATDLKAERDAAKIKADNAAARQDELIEEVGTANKALTKCKALAADPAKDCAAEETDLKEAKATLRAHIVDVASPADDALNEAELAFNKVQNKVIERNKVYGESIQPMLDLQDRLIELNSRVFDLYKQYSPLEGAVGQIVYSVPWDKLVKEYQALNPGVTFTRMPIKDAAFTATVRMNGQNDPSLPAILWSRVPGAQARGPANPPSGEAVVGPNPSAPSNQDISDVSIGFGNSVSGQLALALTGACEYFPNGADPSKKDVSAKDFVAHLVGNVVYTYEVAARRGYTARYNLSNFVSRIEKNKKKGGWFSTKNIHSVIEDNKSDDWFNIKFDADSKEFQYTEQEQKDLTRDVKADLINRAMRNLGAINGLNSTPPPLPPEPGPSGVGAAAASLRSACWWNYWCLAGSYTLGTLDSIFGSKTSVSNFQKSNNVWVTDEVNGIRIIDRSSTFTFRPVDTSL